LRDEQYGVPDPDETVDTSEFADKVRALELYLDQRRPASLPGPFVQIYTINCYLITNTYCEEVN